MPIVKCRNCGGTTNSAVSKVFDNDEGIIDLDTVYECYAKWDEENKKWEKGCVYDKLAPFMKGFVDKLITEQKSD